jgi:outer membrane protein assembly factor BamD
MIYLAKIIFFKRGFFYIFNIRNNNKKKDRFMLIFKKSIACLFYTSLLCLVACSSAPKDDDAKRAAMCKARYDKADAAFKDGKFGRVKEPLEEILTLCAGTGYMEQAQFLLAEAHFNLEEWIEARGEYGSFILNFPGSPFIETAEFRKAISSFNMEYHTARDEANSTIAMKDFERYLSNYPESPLQDSVNFYRAKLMERFAEREYQTAKLYYRMEEPQAAVIYLKEFLEVYPLSKRRSEAFFLIALCYTELDQFNVAREYLAIAKENPPQDVDLEDFQKDIAKAEKKIAKAEKKFEKRVRKEQEKIRQRKDDKKEMIF